MPELKHNFTAGKMNKDLDERLVPNGEYRDAMNIQIRTTSGGDAFSSEIEPTILDVSPDEFEILYGSPTATLPWMF